MLERVRMRHLAESVVGLGAAPDFADRYLELVGAGESDAMRAAMLTMSGCGLTVRGLWRRFGMTDPRLEAPYSPGVVMTTIRDMANEADAWTDGLASDLAIGDVVYVSEPDHVGTVVRVERKAGGAVDVTTVDGGSQDGAGRQLIRTWDRSFAADGTVTGGPLAGNGRRVIGTVSLPEMAQHFGGSGSGAALVGLALVGAGAWYLWRGR